MTKKLSELRTEWRNKHSKYKEMPGFHDKQKADSFDTGFDAASDLWRERCEKLVEALEDKTHNSVRETLALMAEGEGDDPMVYQNMSRNALARLDRALEEHKEWLGE